VTARPREARALLALGVHDWSSAEPAPEVHTRLVAPPGPARLLLLLSDAQAGLSVLADGAPEAGSGPETEGEVRVVELDASRRNRRLRLDLRASSGGILAVWLVPESGRLD
jgi:hypothetical protein